VADTCAQAALRVHDRQNPAPEPKP
jgi:hypothetical protein